MKRKIITVLLGLCLVFAFTACGDSAQQDETSSTQSTQPTYTQVVGTALYNHLSYLVKNSDFNISATKYQIGSTENRSNGSVVVYGTFTMYDKYGQLSVDYYEKPFEITIYSPNQYYVSTCFGETQTGF